MNGEEILPIRGEGRRLEKEEMLKRTRKLKSIKVNYIKNRVILIVSAYLGTKKKFGRDGRILFFDEKIKAL